jgi:hypothetical protein
MSENYSNKEPSDDDEPPYQVGYGKPPKATQFRKGQSGNRKGRPKKAGATDPSQAWNKTLAQTVTGPNGKKRTVMQASCDALAIKALKGDTAAARIVQAEAKNAHARNQANTDETLPDPREIEFLKKIRRITNTEIRSVTLRTRDSLKKRDD